MVYVLWTIVLAIIVVSARGLAVLNGTCAVNEFKSGVPHGSDRYWQLNRVHMNAVENLPLFGAVVLAGVVTGADTATFLNVAWLAAFARIAQSTIHMISTSKIAVWLRVTAFSVQLGSFGVMAILVLLSL